MRQEQVAPRAAHHVIMTPAIAQLLCCCLLFLAPNAFARKLLRTAAPSQAATWYIPPPQTSFFWQLTGTLNLAYNASVFDIDAWDTSAATIAALHKQGKKVICYFSAGSYEDWRPDASQFPSSVKGAKLCSTTNDAGRCTKYWPGERWIDVRSSAVKAIMEARIKMAAGKGCDGVEPDNVDAYEIDTQDPKGQPITKFSITKQDEVAYLTWMANTAHKYNLSIGLKNAGAIAPSLVSLFDWALNEECNAYSKFAATWSAGYYECDYLNLFVRANKAAFVAEYSDFWTTGSFFPKKLCMYDNSQGFTTQEYKRDLNSKPLLNCLDHRPAGCADTWKQCIQTSVYQKYKTDSSMTDADMMGQCMRTMGATACKYV